MGGPARRLDGVRADLAFVRTPDGHGRVELSTFHSPVATSTAPRAPVNVPGIPRGLVEELR